MNGTSRLRNYDDFLRIIEIRRAAELLFEDVGHEGDGDGDGGEGTSGGVEERDKLELLITGEDGDPHLEELKVEKDGSEARRKENRWNRGEDDFIIFREQTLVRREKGILLKKISQIAASIAVRRYPNKISLFAMTRETRSLVE